MNAESQMAPMPTDEEMIDVLVNSLYPGAKRESAAMVLAYCRAAHLDPLLKPVHIVPMSVKSGTKNKYGNDEYVNRDTIMPGIGLYRVNAARTGQYAGQDEPALGPTKSVTFKSVKREWVEVPGRDKKQPRDTTTDKYIEFPEWAQVTVWRLVNGFRVAFTAREYWMENYATESRDSDAPNSMWSRRTIGQLVKCAEAQALRKGFPEVGSQPTAEEMEGRVYEVEAEAPQDFVPKVTPQRMSEAPPPAITHDPAPAATFTAPPPAADPVPTGNVATPAPAPAAATPAPPPPAADDAPTEGEPASEGERKNVLITAKGRKIDLATVLQSLNIKRDPATLEGLTKPEFKSIKAQLV